MKKIIIPALIVGTIAIGSGVLIFTQQNAFGSNEKQVPMVGAMVNKVTTTVQKMDLESNLTALGSIELNKVNSVYSKSSEKVLEISKTEGDNVEANEAILSYDTSDTISELTQSINEMKIEIENAKISLNQLSAPLSTSEEISYKESITQGTRNVENAENNIKAKEASIAEVERNIELQEKTVSDAKIEMENYEKLYNEGIESLSTYNSNVASYENQLNQLETLKKNLETANNDLVSAKKNYEDSKVDLQNAELKYEIAKDPLSDINIKSNYQQQSNSIKLKEMQLQEKETELNSLEESLISPYRGTIIAMNATEGSSIAEGNIVYTIGDYDNLIVTSTVSQYDIADVKVG
ncbi:MAG: HlyD family secretion protein, partial [Lachnospirales bacterium]